MTVGNATGRVKTTSQDKWGRWSSQTFQGRAGVTLTIISAYQVVTDSPGKGLTTAASQQHSLLIQEQDPVTSPRVAFRRDLKRYLHQCQSEGHEILLVGDFNEQIGEEQDSMQSIINDIGLIDIMKHRHGGSLPATYARGQRCLDFAPATPHVINAVEQAGYEAFNARYQTDHRAYFVDLSTDKLFGIQIQPLSKHEPRVLKANNLKQVTAYIKAKHKYLEAHNVFDRMKRLELSGNRHKYAEKIDKDVEAASLAAEKSIPHFDKPFWSVELSQARKKVQVAKKCLSMARTRLDNWEVISREWREAFASAEIPKTTQECKELLKDLNRQVQELVKSSYETREKERQ